MEIPLTGPNNFKEWLENKLESVREDHSPYLEYLAGYEHALELVLDELHDRSLGTQGREE